MRIYFIILSLVILFSSCKESNSSEIKKVFYEFNKATISAKGDRVFELSDSLSHRYYADLLQKTLTYDSTQIAKANIVDKINILSSRVILEDSILLNLTTKDFINKMYTEINTMDADKKKALQNMKIKNVVVTGDSAIGELAPDGRSISPQVDLKFYKENGKWKYNVLTMVDYTESNLNTLLTQNNMSHAEFLTLVFSDPSIQGKMKKRLDEVWKPIK